MKARAGARREDEADEHFGRKSGLVARDAAPILGPGPRKLLKAIRAYQAIGGSGPVRIGDHARIGANAVVLNDVPAGADAVGVPARIVGEETSVH